MRIERRSTQKNTYEANGITPAPISKAVSKFKKTSLALPKGPSTITRGEIGNPGMVRVCSYNLSTIRYVTSVIFDTVDRKVAADRLR